MKILKEFLLLTLLLSFFETYAQTKEIYGDSIELSIDGYKNGKIQWQISSDSLNWNNIEGANANLYDFVNTKNNYYRAKITDRNCSYISTSFKIYFNDSAQIFGVRINRNTPTINSIERIYNSVGKESFVQVEGSNRPIIDDFLNVYPFNKMRTCNVQRVNTVTKITYENEKDFNRNIDTFEEIPLFYMKRYFQDGYDYRLISQTKYDGFSPAPMFLEGDSLKKKVYIAVYETSIDDKGIARSVTGKIPASGMTLNEFRKIHTTKGTGFSTVDVRTIMSLQHLYLIRFANKNSQEYIGGGWENLIQPIEKTVNIGLIDSIVLNQSESSARNYWFIGQNVCTVKGFKAIEYAKIIKIKVNTPLKNQTTLILDKKINLDGILTFGSSAQNTGWSDILSHDTGRTKQNTYMPNTEACSVKLFGIENLWGNVWLMLDGLIFKGLVPYIGFDTRYYNDNGDGYIPMSFQCLEQNDNGTYNGTFGFIDNLGIDNTNSWLSFPESFGKNGVNGFLGYGDYFYQSNNLKENIFCTFGGGFDHFDRGGLFCFRNWNSTSRIWYLQGSRIQFKL